MENFVLSVPQGMYVCIDIRDFNKQTNQKQIDVIFTDNLFTCSCFFIKDINNNFVIFAHIDASTNTIDPDNGLFAILEKKQQQYGLLNEDIEIYFEHGVNNPNPNPFGNDYLVSFDYKNYVESYLKEKNKNYTMHEIGPNMQETTVQQYHNNEDHTCFKLTYNSSHQNLTGDDCRRYAAFDIINKKFTYGYGNFKDFLQKSHLTGTSYKQLMKRDDIETERLLFDENNFGTLSNDCLCGKYIQNIKEIIKARLNEHNEKHNNYDEKIEHLFTQKDWIFPPICILDENTSDINKIGIENQKVEKQIVEYSKSIWTIIKCTKIEDLKQLLEKDLLEEYINIQFNEKYNKMPRENNYFLKQLKEEETKIILVALNNTENQMSAQDANSSSSKEWSLLLCSAPSKQNMNVSSSEGQLTLPEEIQSPIPSSIPNEEQSLLSQNQIELTTDKIKYEENNSIQTEEPNAIINASESDTPHSQTQSVQNTNYYNKQQQLLPESPESLHQISSSKQKEIIFTDDSIQQKTQSSIPNSIPNEEQSLLSQNQIELVKDETEYEENNSIQTEEPNAIINASESDTPHSQTQSVQNTSHSFNKEQTSTLQKPESLPSTMKSSLQKLESPKNETKTENNPIQTKPFITTVNIPEPNALQNQTPFIQDATSSLNKKSPEQSALQKVNISPTPSSKPLITLVNISAEQIPQKTGIPRYRRRPFQITANNNQNNISSLKNNQFDVSQMPSELIVTNLQQKIQNIPEIIRNQAEARTASLERNQQIQRSSSPFNSHHQ